MAINLKLTVSETYALQGILIGLEGLTTKICNDYGVDRSQLLNRLSDATDKYVENLKEGAN